MPLKVDLFETSLLAERRLGLPPLFYHRLQDINDDWGFVLKLHSFFEGVLRHCLSEKLARKRQLGLSMTARDSFISYVNLANRAGIMEPDREMYLLALNRLRNDVTHNITFIDFELRRFVQSLRPSVFSRSAKALCTGVLDLPIDQIESTVASKIDRIQTNQRIATLREFLFVADPRLSIWFSGLLVVDLLALHSIFDTETLTLTDPTIEGSLQDIMHDPEVLEYRRRFKPPWIYE
jgi:hypothetical protein